AAYLIAGAFIVLSKILRAYDLSRVVVEKRKLETAKALLVARNNSNKYNIAKAKSLQYLKLRIGHFYEMNHHAVVAYCEKLTDELINATIAFEIK
ncbi:unnamed protein product, partial [Orchesella dallaii]